MQYNKLLFANTTDGEVNYENCPILIDESIPMCEIHLKSKPSWFIDRITHINESYDVSTLQDVFNILDDKDKELSTILKKRTYYEGLLVEVEEKFILAHDLEPTIY